MEASTNGFSTKDKVKMSYSNTSQFNEIATSEAPIPRQPRPRPHRRSGQNVRKPDASLFTGIDDTNVRSAERVNSGGSTASTDAATSGRSSADPAATTSLTSSAEAPEPSPADADGMPDDVFWDGPAPAKQSRHRGKPDDDLDDLDTPRFVWVPRWAIRLTHGGAAAILLARLVYWCAIKPDSCQRMRPQRFAEQQGWMPGLAGIQRQTGLVKGRAQRALAELKRRHLIEVDASERHWELVRDGREKSRLRIILDAQLREKLMLTREMPLYADRKLPGVRVRVREVMITRRANEAIVLGAILPWFEPNEHGKTKLRINRDGNWWRANSHVQLADETGLSATQVKRALVGLKKAGLIVTADYLFQGRRTLHVRIDNEAIEGAWHAVKKRVRRSEPVGSDE
jgi:hypothetical protein